jgi:alpha-tubulin suppressor-like RCC1 family protein
LFGFVILAGGALGACDAGDADFAAGDVELAQGALACGPVLLAPKAATASSQENANLGAALAIDGNLNTRWSSAFSDPQWITVDYGAPVLFKQVKITWEAAYSKNYDVQVSNSTAGPWTTIYSRNPFAGGVDDKTGLAATGRYLRVYSNARGTAFGNSIKELQAWGNTDLACLPVCTTGATKCLGPQVVTCDANGVWGDPAACASGGVCDGAACVAQVTMVPAPFSYYPLETNSYTPTGPNAVDVQGGGYHAHASNVTLAAGKVGNGFVFNGQAATSATASKLALGLYGNRAGTQFSQFLSLCMWVKPQTAASGKAQPIYSTTNEAPYNTLAIASASPPAGSCGAANELFMGSNSAGNTCERSGLTVTPGAWNHVCYSHNYVAHTSNFWVNGVASAQTVNVWSNNLWANDRIGFASVTNTSIYAGAFNGTIDEVALFNVAVTTTLASQLYNAGKGAQPHAASQVGGGGTGLEAKQVSQADQHSCAVVSDGTVWCWGSNATGQLGNGSVGGTVKLAQQVPGLTGVKKVSTLSSGATCALLTSGGVKCWGDNWGGQMGTGTLTAPVPSPTTVAGVANATDLEAGNTHTCVLLTDKTVQCWGSNVMGQLGVGSTSATVGTPKPVLATTGAANSKLANVTALMNGGWNNHMCAVLSDQTAVCWGDDEFYQLGIQIDGRAPQTCSNHQPCTSFPKPVLGLGTNKVFGIAGGTMHTCLLTTAGTVGCMGANNSLQLGLDRMYQDSSLPDKQAAAVTTGVRITAGDQHNCVIFSDGTAGCWGNNAYGQAGNNTYSTGLSQWWLPVMGDTYSSTWMQGVTAIDAGGNGTCAITHGVLFCWGRNVDGQVGNGAANATDVLIPYPVQ